MKKRFKKIYLEIANVCNLKCSFCPGTKRAAGRINVDQFSHLLSKIGAYTDYIYFHLMGEPLFHPDLGVFLRLAGEAGLKVIITTNGTLLHKQQECLLSAPALHKMNISLHAFEANELTVPFHKYLEDCFSFGKAAEGNKLIVYRLWNQGGANQRNQDILECMKQYFPEPWIEERNGYRIGQRVYLEYGDKFDWPDMSAQDMGDRVFCYGLKDQLGILCDGTVVPCCLDHEGNIPLGNLFYQEMEDILSMPLTKEICKGFQQGKAVHELCRKCGYARRFG